MDINYHLKGAVPVIESKNERGRFVKGDIDAFIDALISIEKGMFDKVAFDMTEKPFLNSEGLSELIHVKDRLHDNHKSIILVSVSQRILSLLQMVGIQDFFIHVENEDAL